MRIEIKTTVELRCLTKRKNCRGVFPKAVTVTVRQILLTDDNNVVLRGYARGSKQIEPFALISDGSVGSIFLATRTPELEKAISTLAMERRKRLELAAIRHSGAVWVREAYGVTLPPPTRLQSAHA